ncbi:MAG: hypothetical protein DME09_07790 [Candidatus Rokuibacteriota bacterium]|nr:MAG: hypothetical protein DME09_07790 [Candidatus Rokubacteria bacterium]
MQKGMVYAEPGLSQIVVQAYLTKSEVPSDLLTPRAREVPQFVAEGKTTKVATRPSASPAMSVSRGLIRS